MRVRIGREVAVPGLEEALSRRPDEPLPAPPPREMTWRGRVWRALHFAVVYASTFSR